jgi:hypothetical protein
MDFGAPMYVTEAVTGLVLAILLYLALGSYELLSNYIKRLENNRVDLLPNTYIMNSKFKQ